MKNFLEILLIIAMASTTVVLGIGIFNLLRRHKVSAQSNNRLMSLRVLFQAVALGILALLFILRK